MFRTVRKTLMVLLLVAVALGAWRERQRIAEWKYTVRAIVYPIVGDDSEATRRYVEGLRDDDFRFIEVYMNEEAARHEVEPEFGEPIRIDLGPRIESLPPPAPVGGNVLEIMWWSLRLRYWAWRVATWEGLEPQVRLFVVYFDPKKTDTVTHSLGIEKGAIGVVHAFAAEHMAGQNNVVIAHELAHTLGATDKYDPATTLPRYPEGYARPDAEPLYPQRFAELMGGRTPLSESEAKVPTSLNETIIGEETAREIHWLE